MTEVSAKMNLRILALTVALGVPPAATPVFAHHSTSMYNMANPVTVTGTVKRFEWINPHAFIYLEVTDEKGNKVEWAVEMMSLNHLKSYGWMHNTVKPGEVISCTGGAAKSGDPAMISSLIKLADGRVIKS
jgi:DNA/RNA endonuclease YhcR with UshA esterase domain